MEPELQQVQLNASQGEADEAGSRQPGLPPPYAPTPRMSLEDLSAQPEEQQSSLSLEVRDGLSQRRGALCRVSLSHVVHGGITRRRSSSHDKLTDEESKPGLLDSSKRQQLASNITGCLQVVAGCLQRKGSGCRKIYSRN